MRAILHRVNPDDERGVTVLIVALALAVIFGMTVLVVDLGALIVKHRGLVNANDAAAVAAAGSFARNEAQAGSNEDPAVAQANRFALSNVGDAEHDTDWWTVSPGLSTSDCDPLSCGAVRVRYQASQALFFGPVIGLGDQVTAHRAASAIWGPAGGGRPAPITVHYDWLDDCGVPNYTPRTDCAFWLDGRHGDDDDDEDGDSQWAWIDLDRWDVSRSAGCPHVDSDDLSAWIAGRGPQVRVNPVPTPTFVCTADGHASRYFADLESQEGTFKVLPVNDASGDFAPPGQTGNKYDIVGFTTLRIDDVLHGDDPAAIGDPGITNCSWEPPSLEPGQPVDLKAQPCSLTNLRHPDPPHPPYPKVRKGSNEFSGDVIGQCLPRHDYCYAPDTNEITWQGPEPLENPTIEWQAVDPSEGKCGIRQPDEKAVCLVVSWQGYRSGGINPGGGVDFGLRAVRLSA